MHFLLRALLGADRSAGDATQQVVEAVLMQPALLSVLFDGLHNTDPVLRVRCAQAIDAATILHHDWLLPFKPALFALLAQDAHEQVRHHVARLLARLPLNADEQRIVSAA